MGHNYVRVRVQTFFCCFWKLLVRCYVSLNQLDISTNAIYGSVGVRLLRMYTVKLHSNLERTLELVLEELAGQKLNMHTQQEFTFCV